LAFFKKLKDRLFKSSSKIDEGLEAIVSDGGEAETVDDAAVAEAAQRQAAEAERVEAERLAAQETERAAAEEVERQATEAAARAARLEAERAEAARREEVRLEEARLEAERAERAAAEQRAREAELAQARADAAEAARKAEAQAIQDAADEAAQIAAARAAQEAEAARLLEAEAAENAARLAEEQRVAAAEAAEAEAARAAEEARLAADKARQEAAELRAAETKAQHEAEAAKAKAAEIEAAQRAQAARDAAAEMEAQRAPAEPLRTTLTPVAPDLVEETQARAEKTGLLGRLMGRATAKTVVRRTLDDDMLEQLEELLITADMGVDTALRVTANMAEGRFGKKLSVAEIKQLMADEIARIMEPVARPLPLYPKTPQVVLVVGVNGSGKTTTIGKLASQFRAAGKKVVIAAGDTFRAAAVEQLQVWGERAGVPVLTAAQGSDPASLAFDAMGQAQADGADLLLIDTAGRLQNRGDLMEELAKIVRVIRKKDETAPHNTLLVLDATTGQNALNQVKVFQDISDVSGLVMTKLDGTAKGGVLVALADKFGLPIHAIGVGEQIDDLSPFDPEEFADALVGFER